MSDISMMVRFADLSDCGTFRFNLVRVWSNGPRVMWIMLNPSTADALEDDPTIRRCIGFSKAWGYGSLEVVNLFAFRATDPDVMRKRLMRHPDEDSYIRNAADRADMHIAAWGAAGGSKMWQARHANRVVSVMRLLAEHDVYTVGPCENPRHPLYLKGDLKPVLWRAKKAAA